MIKIAINGLGRIGRPVFRKIMDTVSDLEVAAVNDLAEPKVLAHLLKYDSIYGIYDKEVKAKPDSLEVEGAKVRVFAEKDPADLPWKEMGIDIVLECTGAFRDIKGAGKHIAAGAKQLVVQEPMSMILSFAGSNLSALTPSKNVGISWSLAGAEMSSYLAPAAMCFPAPLISLKAPGR